MGFNSNKSDTAVVKEGKLYTGLKNMKVIAINPTKVEMEAIGYRPKNDPVYMTMDGEVKKLRLDFFLQGDVDDSGTTVRAKIAFFLENKFRVNKDGTKAEWINDIARTAWGTPDAAPDGFKWFEPATARRCFVGEGDVHLFLINWLNIQPGDEAKLENFAALFDGDYKELHSLLAGMANNEVKVLLCVREGKYQSAYARYFDRATNKRTSYWEAHIKRQSEEGYPIKEDFSNSFVFQEWTEPTAMVDAGGSDDDDGAKDDDPF